MIHKVFFMFLFSASCYDAEITKTSIADFNIGQIFAFNDIDNFCKSPVQFVVAKRAKSSKCQWKVREDLQPQKIQTYKDLPIEDYQQNCLFSCDYGLTASGMKVEGTVNQFFAKNASNRQKDYDLYTYIAPCDKSIRGKNSTASKEDFEKYNGVYFTSNPERCDGFGNEVSDDEVLTHGTVTGLLAAKKNTAVSLDLLKSVVNDLAERSQAIKKTERNGPWFYNAVVSYFDQHSKKSQVTLPGKSKKLVTLQLY